MKKALIILNLLIINYFCFAQENFLIGKWKYEKIPDHIEIDEQGLKMANEFFKEMTLSFDQTNYTQFVMGKSENGTWSLISENNYEFNSSNGYKYEVEIKKISSNQIIFKHQNREWQLLKSDEKATLQIEVSSRDKIDAINIKKENLIGKWFHNGQIKDGKDIEMILKHNNTEIVNYTFLENGKFINKAPFEIELIANWKMDDDNQTLIIESEDLTEFLKIIKLNNTELHLFNPKNKSIIKFRR
ncbi:hypothetical protein [Lacinutrix algicola]|uniref:hypothetical protein n=1 Tax=Lacinutrix algicola TaxID=342954 RepID=UPI0006E249A4|nr:hypothetical protein [Lacinutrix algicola]